MNKRIFDDAIQKALGLSTVDEAIRKLTAIDKLREAERLALRMAQPSELSTIQRQLDESQKISHSLLIKQENAWRRQCELQALGVPALRHLDTFREIVQIENTTLENLRRLTAATTDYVRQYRGTTSGILEQTTKGLDFRNHLMEDSLSRVAQDATRSLRSLTSTLDDGLSQVTKGIIDSYSLLRTAQHDLAAEEFHRITAGIREAQLVAFPSVIAMADQMADVLRMQLPASALDATFAGELLDRLLRAEAITSASEEEEFLVVY